LYTAGLESGDLITHLDGKPFTAEAYQAMQENKKPGATVVVEYTQMGSAKQANVLLIEDPTLRVVPFEALNRPVTEQMKTFRQKWLESKVKP
jgi:predicted metalloprotease with PDZ domain